MESGKLRLHQTPCGARPQRPRNGCLTHAVAACLHTTPIYLDACVCVQFFVLHIIHVCLQMSSVFFLDAEK